MSITLKEQAVRAIKSLKRVLGSNSVMLMSSTEQANVPIIPTGSMGLDRALGVGGIPTGRIAEIYGPEASGKTTVMLNLVAQCQQQGGLAAFIDAEHALDPSYAKRIGVDIDSLLLAQPDCGEEAMEITEQLIHEGKVALIVIDSVSALVPRAEIAGQMGDHHVGLQARLMSQALRKLAPVVYKAGSSVVFINQLRSKIGNAYGSSETTSGGRALRFYSSVRLDIRRIATLKDKDRAYGNRVRVKVTKNKVAPPHGQTEFDIIFGKGIDTLGELIDLGIQVGACDKSGAWYALGDTQLGQGRAKAIERLSDEPAMAVALKSAIEHAWAAEQVETDQSKAALAA